MASEEKLTHKKASSLRSRLKPGSAHYVAVPKGVEYQEWSDNWGPGGTQEGAFFDLFEVWRNYERRSLGRPESEAAFPIRAQVINRNGRRGKSFHLPDDPRIVVLSELDGMKPKDALQEWYKLRSKMRRASSAEEMSKKALREILASEGLLRSAALDAVRLERNERIALIWAAETGLSTYRGRGAFTEEDLTSALKKLYRGL